SQPLFLNPHCSILPAEQLPEELMGRSDLASNFVQQGTIAWVRDSVTRSILPFWLGPRLEAAVQNLQLERLAQETLNARHAALLAAAGILVFPENSCDEKYSHSDEGDRLADKSCELLQSRRYVPASDLIHPFHIAALRRYYRFLIRQGKILLGDDQSSRRYIAYNEPVARFFHQQIAARVEKFVGEPIKPSYVYLAS